MKTAQQGSWALDSEMFGEGKRHYFIDLKISKNRKHYLRITRSDTVAANQYRRSQLILFEEDLGFFVEALTMVLGRLSQGQSGTSA